MLDGLLLKKSRFGFARGNKLKREVEIIKVEIIEHSNGDWVIIKVNGEEYFSGHSIPTFVWLKILSLANIETSIVEEDDDEDADEDWDS